MILRIGSCYVQQDFINISREEERLTAYTCFKHTVFNVLDKHSYKQVFLCLIKQVLMQLCLISTSMMWHNKKPFADKVDSNLAGLQKKCCPQKYVFE